MLLTAQTINVKKGIIKPNIIGIIQKKTAKMDLKPFSSTLLKGLSFFTGAVGECIIDFNVDNENHYNCNY